jgi:hypothetical protein
MKMANHREQRRVWTILVVYKKQRTGRVFFNEE